MRRSAAPSQLASASKRPRFMPPFANKPPGISTSVNTTNTPKSCGSNSLSTAFTSTSSQKDISSGSRSTSNVLRLIQLQKPAEQHPCKILEPLTKPDPPQAVTSDATQENSYSGKVREDTSDDSLTNANPSPVTLPNQLVRHDSELCSKLTNVSSDIIREEPQDKAVNGENVSSTVQTALASTSHQILKPRMNGLHRSSFRQPLLHKAPPLKTATEENLKKPASHYYSVVWCKLSKKKHKKWEGDAILVTKGKSVTLLDTEGKEIGKGRGYKSSELSSMAEGHTLCIGGKEIEVMGGIKQEDFTSGKCFQTTSTASSFPAADSLPPKPRRVAAKPFMNPQKASSSPAGNSEPVTTTKSAPKPLHDPTHPDALVMPRPSPAHQWAHNPQHHPVVDVVLDPYLSSKLRPHQREGVLFLYECVMGLRSFQGNGAILADDMGLGKTLQCICLIWTLCKQGPYRAKPVTRRVLIVTPGSLVKNWCREFKKWLGNERMRVFAVSADKKVQEFASSPIYPILIISYEMFVRSIEDIRKINFDLIVCDEGHRLKNTNIKTTSLISSLPVQRRILLTGTPVQNDLQEFHSIVEFCNPGVLGSSAAFHRVYEDPITKGNQPQAKSEEKKLAATRAAELSRLTGLFVLRRTQEINNKYLPPKVETVVFCKPSPLQLLLYQWLLSSRVLRSCLTASSQYAEASFSSPHLVCITALKKLCNHPGLLHQACLDADTEHRETGSVDDGFLAEESLYKDLLPFFPDNYTVDSVDMEHSGKMQVLADLLCSLHENGPSEKIVLVSNYTQTLGFLQKLCEQEGYKFCRLDGSTPTARRQEIVEHFNSSYSQETVFLLSSKAGGVGLNLIGASRLLLYDIDWNPANDLQAMARVWRDGQKRQVHIYRLITTGTIEEKVYQRQISKQGLSGAVVDAKSHGHVKFSLEDLRDLFTLHESTACVTHDMMACTCLTGEETVREAPQTAPSRACQLGVKRNQDRKNLSMNQLMEWKHFSGPLSSTFEDDHLLRAGSQITFAFQNKTNDKSTDE
ncbi:DNA repair and recombination protein RAD54B-like [Acanthaster planci]|uniref:DNA repair and recombination protein RAD54B-like n=1 Tax=Acanthaster planci TaxID=133434 RepID=A0A8B7XXL0_ACAPL|nr:DNA repair and recombination protein RAD54B-like [Acanthaster planci]